MKFEKNSSSTYKKVAQTRKKNHSRFKKETNHINSSPVKNFDNVSLYKAVLLGKPNVGKSSLFNKLTKTNTAIITNQSGTTRDSINRVIKWNEEVMLLTDLPGWDDNVKQATEHPKTDDPSLYNSQLNQVVINDSVRKKIKQELDDSDIVVMVFDVKDITEEDKEILTLVRSHLEVGGAGKNNKKSKDLHKPIIYCANKCDRLKDEWFATEIYEFDVDEVVTVSVLHSSGFQELLEKLFSTRSKLIQQGIQPYNHQVFLPSTDYKLALVGRPNAGKSSLFNALLNKQRAVVSEVEGTTRDIVEDYVVIGKHNVKLIDTGGMRKRSKKKKLVEQFSIQKSIHAINQSDVVVIVVDAVNKLSEQDKKISALAISKKKSVIVVFNKWDLIEERWEDYHKDLLLSYPPIKEFILLPISANNRRGLVKLLKIIDDLYVSRAKKIAPAALNRALKVVSEQKILIGGGTSGVKIHYAMQVQNHPPVFYIYVNRLNRVKNNFRQYVYNYIEELMNLKGTPLTIRFFERRHNSKT